MRKVNQLLRDGGWKKAPDFTSEQMEGIINLAMVEPTGGFILCPFGFRAGLDKKGNIKNGLKSNSGLKPVCPVHGDNCPGLNKFL